MCLGGDAPEWRRRWRRWERSLRIAVVAGWTEQRESGMGWSCEAPRQVCSDASGRIDRYVRGTGSAVRKKLALPRVEVLATENRLLAFRPEQ